MLTHSTLLAAVEDATAKAVVGVVVFALWGCAQIISKINERKTPTPLPKLEIPQGPPSLPTLSRRTQPNKRAQIQQGKQDRQNRGLQSQQAPPPMINQGARTVGISRPKEKTVPIEEPQKPTTASPVTLGYYHREGPTRAEITRAQLHPTSLRNQFILTEILQKPVSMREDEVTQKR